ncbi:RDD family protein [Kitasatospora sp. NBC_00315]|uniref:RDD family protein n=1 Tax=Kitasatospora sp. NBC_00315 TaxID=2975963 RepID=UPI0032467FD9
MSDLVTGEAVVLGLRAAKVPSRALAVLLDLLVESAAFLVAIFVLALTASEIDDAAVAATVLAMMVFFLVAVPVMVETLSGGRSLGKLALGLRVVRRDGGPVRFRHSLVRGLVGFFEIISFSGIPALICSLISPEGRRLGDIFAGTLVVRERVPGSGRGGVSLPPLPPQLMHALGGELVALDLSAVPEGLWLAIRQLLGRLGQLDPQVAQTMAVSLAGDLAARTGHPAPPGVHPAAYLGAVLAERQRREWARANAFAARQPAAWAAGAAPWPAGPQPVAAPPQQPYPYLPQQPAYPYPPRPAVPAPVRVDAVRAAESGPQGASEGASTAAPPAWGPGAPVPAPAQAPAVAPASLAKPAAAPDAGFAPPA